jgi:hypothetical protein
MRSEMTTSRVTRSLRMSFVTTAMSKRIVAVTKRKWKTKLKTVKRRRWVLEDRDDCAQRLANDSSNKKSSASVSIQWHPRHTPPQAAVIFDSNPDFVPRRYSFVAADYVPQACCSVHSRAASGCKKHMNHFIITFATNSHETNAITPTPDARHTPPHLRLHLRLESCGRNSFRGPPTTFRTPAARCTAASGCKKHTNHFIITFATNSHETNAITPTPDAQTRVTSSST